MTTVSGLMSDAIGADGLGDVKTAISEMIVEMDQLAPTFDDIGDLVYGNGRLDGILNHKTPGEVIAFLISTSAESILFDHFGYVHNKEAQLAIDNDIEDAPSLERFNYLMEALAFIKDMAFEETLYRLTH